MLVTLATVQLSSVTGVPKTTPDTPHVAVATTVSVAGAIIVGFTVSTTVTNWLTDVELPLVSITVQTTVVVPNKNVVGALLVTLATEQLSAVTGVPKFTL